MTATQLEELLGMIRAKLQKQNDNDTYGTLVPMSNVTFAKSWFVSNYERVFAGYSHFVENWREGVKRFPSLHETLFFAPWLHFYTGTGAFSATTLRWGRAPASGCEHRGVRYVTERENGPRHHDLARWRSTVFDCNRRSGRREAQSYVSEAYMDIGRNRGTKHKP